MKKVLAIALAAIMLFGLVACSSNDDASGVKLISINLSDEEYAFGVDKNQPELLEDVNAFIKKILSDGTFDSICNNYFGDGTPKGVASAELDTSKDQLIVATNAEFAPFEYVENDLYYGIDMEVAALLAEELGKELVIDDMDFEAVCTSVGEGKCDIAMAGLTVSEKRKEIVTFTESYYAASQQIIVKADDTRFDACTDLASVEAILAELPEGTKIGAQAGTTGQSYIEGNDDLEFAGIKNAECVSYDSGALAAQDLLNGNIDFVIIDAAPAAAIVASING